jgi:ectoine hydroxylase
MADRRDPVLYGSEADGPLGRSELQFYDRNGYLFFDSLFSEGDIAGLLSELEYLNSAPELQGSEYVIREPESDEVRSLFYVHKYDAVFKALARDRRVLDVARQILGSDVYLLQSRVNLKPGFHGKDFFWHSDFETWHAEDGLPRMRTVSCSITLTDNNEFNGPLMVIPGSHRKYISCVGATPENHYLRSLRKQEVGVPDEALLTDLVQEHGIEAPKGKAGSVLFFDCNLLHGSASNISPFPRTNAFFVYNSIDNALVDPFSGSAARPEHISARADCKPLQPGDLGDAPRYRISGLDHMSFSGNRRLN